MKKKSVFVIGDSISCYYGRHLKKILDDVHFNEKGSGLQAAFIAGYLNAINQQADR